MLRPVSKLARVLLVALLQGFALPASGQAPGDRGAASVGELALDWARGRFASPVICQLGGEPVRGIRRVSIAPGPAHQSPQVNRLIFVDLEVGEASRCFAELVGDVPNITGSVQFHVLSTRSSDTARRDFRETLRRKGGFEFHVREGVLRLQPVTQPPSPVRRVDFRGGRALLRDLAPGSDEHRLLAAFRSPRKMLLELSARDGTKLSFPLYMTDLR